MTHLFGPNKYIIAQILLRIENEAFAAGVERLGEIQADSTADSPASVAQAIERVFNSGNYVVLRHQRIVEESIAIPEWLDETVRALTPQNRPMLFIISQLPVTAARRNNCSGNLCDQRIPTIDEVAMEGFANQLIAHFDPHHDRWDEDQVRKLVSAAGGTPGFLVSLVRSAARIEDFDKIDEFVRDDAERMAESITTYAQWAFGQLLDMSAEQKTLLFLNDVSPCDPADIELAVAPDRPIAAVLGKLLDLGLIEREAPGLYRLTPLLARRLSRNLIGSDLLNWRNEALRGFASTPINFDTGDHDFVRIEARIQASLWGESDELPNAVTAFMSAAHWFQAGIRLYHARHREPAYRLLRKAFAVRDAFSWSSRAELTRYFGLSAVQNHKQEDVDKCIALLSGDHRTKSLAPFLRGYQFERQRRYYEAVREYEKALALNASMDRRMERTYRPLIKCILSTPKPDYAQAEMYVLDWLNLSQTLFSKTALARVYLHRASLDNDVSEELREELWDLYDQALKALRSDPGGLNDFYEIQAEEFEIRGAYEKSAALLDAALKPENNRAPRFELRLKRWQMMSKSNNKDLANLALEELELAKYDPQFRGNWNPFLEGLVECYIRASKVAKISDSNRVNRFAAPLKQREIARIITGVNRELVPDN